jgi:hypothetical protein
MSADQSVSIATGQLMLPFDIEPGDFAFLVKALSAYRPETSEEDALVHFFIEQFSKLDQPQQ